MTRTRQELRAVQDRRIKAHVDAIVALLALAAKASHTNAQSV
jgi:hypothetical protein